MLQISLTGFLEKNASLFVKASPSVKGCVGQLAPAAGPGLRHLLAAG